MRITSGYARGISIASPRGDTTRPATDAAREAIFSSLGELVADANVVDLFAGTGSYGLEAASRGAKSVVFIERDRNALVCLKKNISEVAKALSQSGRAPLLRAMSLDVLKSAKSLSIGGEKPTLIFADPPYKMLSDPKTLPAILSVFGELASESEAVCVLEAPAEFELPDETRDATFAFELIRRLGKKSKGKPSQLIFKAKRK